MRKNKVMNLLGKQAGILKNLVGFNPFIFYKYNPDHYQFEIDLKTMEKVVTKLLETFLKIDITDFDSIFEKEGVCHAFISYDPTRFYEKIRREKYKEFSDYHYYAQPGGIGFTFHFSNVTFEYEFNLYPVISAKGDKRWYDHGYILYDEDEDLIEGFSHNKDYIPVVETSNQSMSSEIRLDRILSNKLYSFFRDPKVQFLKAPKLFFYDPVEESGDHNYMLWMIQWRILWLYPHLEVTIDNIRLNWMFVLSRLHQY